MSARIALYGGSFNPPGRHHRTLVERLAQEFDRVVIVPCGPRPDKSTTSDIEPIHRASLADLAFGDLPNVQVELFDLEQSTFTRTVDLEHKFSDLGELWHVIGADQLARGPDGLNAIQCEWQAGTEIWQRLKFAVVTRPEYPLVPDELPRQHQLFTWSLPGASSLIRERIFKHEPVGDMVSPEVERYIQRYGLYSGRPPERVSQISIADPRVMLLVNEEIPIAREMGAALEHFIDPRQPNLIAVVGGDGTMLHAIRKYWRRRLPFFGINAGHLGFLLNELTPVDNLPAHTAGLIVQQLPLLWVETENTRGEIQRSLAFNDAWVERASGQSARIEVRVNGKPRIASMVADGALLATAAGSTAYAHAIGATPVPIGTPVLILAGSNVVRPQGWRSAVLPLDAEVEFRSQDPEGRPLRGFVDGVDQGTMVRLRARMSRIAAAELAFLPNHDMAEKLAHIQFPPQQR